MIKKVVAIRSGRMNQLEIGETYSVIAIYSCNCNEDNIVYDIGFTHKNPICECPHCKCEITKENQALARASNFADLDEWQEAEESVNKLMKELETVK